MKRKFISCATVLAAATSATAATLSPPTIYRGMCDASAAISLAPDLFAVANDEDNTLRGHHRKPGGLPAFSLDMTLFLRIGKESPEADTEGSAVTGDHAFWIISHGHNAKGKDSRNRERFFATKFTVTNDSVKMVPVGKPYPWLLDDLLREPKLARFGLAAASQRAPKEPGALNIEGL